MITNTIFLIGLPGGTELLIIFLILSILWIGPAIAIGVWGKSKKIGGILAFLISFIFSPVIGIIAVLLSADKTKAR